MGLIHLNNETFDEIIKDGITVVDFYANWCGPCKVLSPTIEKLANEINEVKFVKVDVDKHDELARRYGIMSIPTLVFINNANVVNKHIGLISEEKIKDILDDIV